MDSTIKIALGIVGLAALLFFSFQRDIQKSPADSVFLGSADAPITITEFSDYQSPYSKKFYLESFPKLKEEYIDTGKVRFTLKNFPLDIHPSAVIAAEAAECVKIQNQEAYWNMNAKIFSEQDSLSKENLESWAIEIGYDISSCLESHDSLPLIMEDISEAKSLGIKDVPSFSINDRFISGAQQYNVFKAAIVSELTK